MKYGQCEQYGKAKPFRRLKSLFQRKQGFITIGIPLPIESEEEM
jgi:hypothetical protein